MAAPHQDPSVYPRPHLSHYSPLQLTRLNYHPPTPQVLRPLVNGQQPQVELIVAQKKTSALDAGIHFAISLFSFLLATSQDLVDLAC